MSNIAVLGTDTGIGKTVVTAGLVGRLRGEGVDAVGVKPCQTGHPPDDDAGFVREACDDEAAGACGRYLGPALAPAVAADEADEELTYREIRDFCATELAAAEVGVLEGIGGLRVPLAEGREVVDLVADLGLPAVVVSRSGLGTLNHTALTVEALERRDVPVRGVVLNEYEGASVAERTNPEVLAEMTGHEVATLPPTDLSNPAAAIDLVADLPRYVDIASPDADER
ncbi:dethiobiotin synthase [Haloglomus salinum]|jgi:dethiobiotin synthetase|uniref:dethiobiotin synthase n=1 Tax=Haloglomus salinum TaxID=2962673 RepID=UPI0020C9D084|nr:dethiobiotin synthase [Haloglomus salinum]